MAAFDSSQSARFNISDCSVCFDAYHPQKRIPRMLNACGHTFCEQCLVKLRLSNSPSLLVRCPSCRTQTKLKFADPFPKNFALLDIIEQAQSISGQQEEVPVDQNSLPDDADPNLTQEAHLLRLGSAAAALEDRFAIGGNHPVSRVTIRASKGSASCELSLPSVLQPNGTSAPLDALLAVCDPSGFGHGAETKYDPAVRSACHIPADRLSLDGFNLERSGILDEVRLALAPDAPRVIPRLLKLNVYPEGGHFLPHRDTPPVHPEGMLHLGSLVVALPAAHLGGDLLVQHRGEEKAFAFDAELEPSEAQWGAPGRYEKRAPSLFYSVGEDVKKVQQKNEEKHRNSVRAGMPKRVLPWAAFYGDCEHTVTPVKYGTRISLSYQLFIDAPSALSASSNEATSVPSSSTSTTIGSTTIGSTTIGLTTTGSNQGDEDDEAIKIAKDLALSKSIKEYISNMSVADLKEICKLNGFPASGKKAALLKRLAPVPPHEFLSKLPETLQDIILLHHEPVPPVRFLPAEKSLGKARIFAARLRSALRSKKFMPHGGELGFACFHLYECEADLPKLPLSRDVKAAEIHLKGADAIVALVAARMGLGLRFLRVCHFRDGGDGGWRVTQQLIGHGNVVKLLKDVLVEEEFVAKGLSLEKDYGDSPKGIQGVEWAVGFELRGGRGTSGAKALPDSEKPPVGKLVEDVWMSMTGYFGNEASSGTIYSNVAIVVKVPKYAVRAGAAMECPLALDSVEQIRAGLSARQEERRFNALAWNVHLPPPKVLEQPRRPQYGYGHGAHGHGHGGPGGDEECVIC